MSRIKDFTHTALSEKWWPLTLALILLLFASARVIHITYDPPPELSISAAPFTDEGLKTYSPRNFYYHGDWRWTPEDGYAGWYRSSPLAVRMYRAWFNWFGVSLTTVRLINVLFSVLTMALLFWLVMRYYRNRFTAAASVILFGVSHFIMMFNRLAFFENMLVFFSLAIFYSVCELFLRRKRMKQAVTDNSISTWPQLFFILLAVSVGCAATVAGIFTKQSIAVIVVSIVPFLTLYLFFSHKKLNSFLINKFYVTMIIIVIGYLLLAHFGWFDAYLKELLKINIFNVSIGYLLPLKYSFKNFDPLYLSFIKSLCLEFVYLQPVIFFTGIFYAVKIYYNFLYKLELHVIDTAFATWFLFGFLFLAIMRYHPARYYMLLSIPLVILSARFFTSPESFSFSKIVPDDKIVSVRKLVLIVFWFYLFFYVGVILVNTILPFQAIKFLFEYSYFSIISKEYMNLLPIVAGAVLIQITVFITMFMVVNKIRPSFNSKKYSYLIFIGLILFQTFQYGRWIINSDDVVSSLSERLGSILPEESLLTGCWAASLTLNNKLRAVVIQERLNYNVGLIEKIIADGPVTVFHKSEGGVVEEVEEDLPIYLFVSTNGPFDIPIRRTFEKYIVEERLMAVVEMGLFDVEMYRLDAPPDAKMIEKLADLDIRNRRK